MLLYFLEKNKIKNIQFSIIMLFFMYKRIHYENLKQN